MNRFLKYLPCYILLATCYIMTPSASAGTIIRSPAYLGLQNGLIVCWTFDGSYTKVPDCSGKDNTGSVNNGASKTLGKLGQALKFVRDGNSQHVRSKSLVNTTKVTVSAWVKIPVYPTVGLALVAGFLNGLNSNTYDKDLGIDTTTQKAAFYVWDGSGKTANSSVAMPLNKWTHLVGTADGTNAYIYQDGVQVGSVAAGDTRTGYTVPNIFVSGTTLFDDLHFIDGTIDEVRVYDRALSANEIARLYRIGLRSTVNRSLTNSNFDKGLVGHWTFDGGDIFGTSARDKSGQGNHGTITNSPLKKPGKVGQALDFDGSDDTVNVNDATSLRLSAPFTFTAWIKRNATGGVSHGFLSKHQATGDWLSYFILARATNELRFGMDDNVQGSTPRWDSATTLAANRWYHVVAVIRATSGASTDVDLYINGAKESTTFTAGGYASGFVNRYSTDPVLLGAVATDVTSSYNNGSLDDVRIYNRALSASEIARLYQTTQSKFNASKTDSLTKGLVGYWTFDGGDIFGLSVRDKSGQGNHGTISGEVKTAGKVGQALDFDGVDNGIIIGSDSPLDNLASYSVSAWIKPRSLGEGSFGRIVAKDRLITDGWAFFVCTTDASPTCTSSLRLLHGFTGTDGVWSSANNSIKLNTWQHVAVTYSPSSTTNDPIFYINGVVSPFSTEQTPTLSDDDDDVNILVIGNRNNADIAFDGLIDDVRLYKRILSAGEVNKLYQMGH